MLPSACFPLASVRRSRWSRDTRLWQRLTCLVALLCSLAGSGFADDKVTVDPLDWPYWRGPEMNGISREKNLPSSWSPEGENLVWKSAELGTRSTPIVLRGKLYTLCRDQPATLQEAEKVVCADANTGEILWETPFNVFLTDVPDTRVGWSSVVGDPETGHIFAQGVCGLFLCLDGESGDVLWSRSLSEEFGLLSTYGGRTNFPILHENLVIISGVVIGWGEMARPAHRILAFDKRNGACVWFQSTRPLPEDTTYSGPVLTVINGQAQFIIGSGDGAVYSLQPRTGKVLWKYEVSLRGINTAPIAVGNMILCGHSEENLDDTKMGALFAVDASLSGDITKTGELWRTKEQFIGKTQPMVLGERVYSVDDSGNFFVNDLKTGQILNKQKLGTMGRGSPVYGDGKFYCADATGRWSIFEPTEKGLKRIHQLRLDAEINGSPIISHGRIYLPTETMMYCIGSKDPQSVADPLPEMPTEEPPGSEDKPTQALLVPVESLLKPGEKQQYQVFLYNERGQYLGVADAGDVKYTITGKATIDAAGKLVTEAGGEHQAVLVQAEVQGLKAAARARVVPEFPWSFSFDEAVVPITGVGLRYRHIGLDFDLYQSLKKDDLLAARLYIFLTTQFTNFPAPVAKLDDSTPANVWTGFKRYLGVLESVITQSSGQAKLDPSLQRLKDAGVIASWEWTGTEEAGEGRLGPQLQVTKANRKVTGNGVMCKITTIPKGTRSQGWMGHPSSKDYEIQADVFAEGVQVSDAADKNSKMPDIGLICQRYRFDLMGSHQQLKLYSWIPHDQKYFEQPFVWSADTWYTMKFRVTNETRDGVLVSVLRGKVWKRDEAEPEAWSIEWTDSPANLSGSPGLFGNAKDAEIFIDNLKVTALAPVQ
jgi:outer membrane protein assembly factor BamB